MVDIKIKEVRLVGVIKKELPERKESKFSLVLWISLMKNGKEKFLVFCINNYSFNNWPLNKLIMHSYIEENGKEIATHMYSCGYMSLPYLLNNLLYVNAEMYTRISDSLYKKDDILTEENVLTEDEEYYIKKIVCSYIYELNDKTKEYYKQQIENLIKDNSSEIRKSNDKLKFFYSSFMLYSEF